MNINIEGGLLFYLLFFTCLALMAFSIIFTTLRNGISPMPTSQKVKKKLLLSMPKDGGEIILELGAGWGTLSFPLAKKYPTSSVVAYENSLVPYLFCLFRQLFYRYPNLQFKREDFYLKSFEKASIIVCYLFPQAMDRLKIKFQKEMSPKTLIITHTFAITGWRPALTITVDDLYHTKIYQYKL